MSSNVGVYKHASVKQSMLAEAKKSARITSVISDKSISQKNVLRINVKE